jgi:hypothetical protein
MITVIDPGRYFHVTVDNGKDRDEEIDEAVSRARASSETLGWMGVMVTRHSPNVFTVALSENVPYGVTAERDISQ